MNEILREEFQQLYPENREIDLEEYFSRQDLLRHNGKPYVIGAMASSLDGRAAWKGTSDELRSSKDDALFYGLRSLVDAVIVGEHALRAEKYGTIIKDADSQQRRLERGQSEQPLTIIISKKFNIPWDIPLFQDEGSRCLIWTTERGEVPPAVKAEVEVFKEDKQDPVSLDNLFAELSNRGIGLILCEGGPALHASLQRAGIIEEFFLALEPELLGRKNISLVEGDFLQPQSFLLRSVLRSDSELFLHYGKEKKQQEAPAPVSEAAALAV